MRLSKVVGRLLAILFVFAAAFGGAIGGLLLIAAMNPGVKGPHITDRQAVTAAAVGALVAAGLAVALSVGSSRRSGRR